MVDDMTRRTDAPPAVVETRVVHDTHRRATSLLAGAAASRDAPPDAVAALRDVVVAMLRHHHESEDRDLWPMLAGRSPSLGNPLHALTLEHDRLDGALDRLAADISPAATAEVRDLVHVHLDHEEPILLPALHAHLTDEEWAAFSQRTVASAPTIGTHLLIGLFHEVAADEDVELVLRHLPTEARALVPAMRSEAEPTLDALDAAS